MKIPSLYNETELERYLKIQQKFAWNLETDFPWEKGIDFTKPLAVLDKQALFFPNASSEQRLILSQYVGLIVASIISEFEKILMRLKNSCWDIPMRKYPVNPELIALGEEFFIEEEKHSLSFERYISLFAKELNLSYDELLPVLPVFNHKYLDNIFNVDALAGGMGVWWVVAAVEEMSIEIYKILKVYENEIDPLYLAVHKRHYEEESRHACYAFLMIDLFQTRGNIPLSLAFKKISFILSEVMTVNWLFGELYTCRKNLLKLQKKHPFFDEIVKMWPMISNYSLIDILKMLFSTTPYLSFLTNPSDFVHVKKSLEKYNIPTLRKNGLGKTEFVSISYSGELC